MQILKWPLLAGLVLVQALAGSALAQEVQVDEFLFPQEGALESNLALLWPKVQETGDAQAQALYGIQLLAKGSHADARQHCSEAHARGLLFEAVYCMSMVQFSGGAFGEAEDLARAAIRLRPRSLAPYIVLANIKLALKDKEGMVQALELGMTAVPERAPFWEWELAKMFESLGDLDAALQCVGVLSQITAQDPKVFTQAGDWLRRKKRLAEAAQMYRFALSKASWYQNAALALLGTYREDEQWGEIGRRAPRLLENPQLRPVHETIRAYLLEANDNLLTMESQAVEARYGVTLAELHTFDAVEPTVAATALLEAARIMVRYGKPLSSLTLLRKALTYDPGRAEAFFLMAEVFLGAQRLDEAEEAVNNGLSLASDSEAFVLAARVARLRLDGEGCIARLKGALQHRSDDVDALLEAALCLRMLRYEGKQLEALKEAYRIDPENTEVLNELVSFYLHEDGGREAAADYLAKLYNLIPYDYRVCGKLAELYRTEERFEDSLATLVRCYDSTPPHLDGLRAETEGKARAAAHSVRDDDKVVRALTELCGGGANGACIDLEAFKEGQRKQRGLTAAPYQLRVRQPLVGELERLGPEGSDFLVLGLEAPGFEALPLKEKRFLFYMTRAAIAGDELLYYQNHRHAILVKRLLERLFVYRKHLTLATAAGIHDYLKYVWLNHGNYDHRSGMKFVPRQLTREALLEAMKALYGRGESFDFIPGAGPQEKFAYLEKSIFDADYEAHLTVTAEGVDAIGESAVNHYAPGITDGMIAALDKEQRNALNVRYALVGGKVVQQKYAVGALGDAYLTNVVHFLRQALPFASGEEQRESVEALIRFYETGDESEFRSHSVAWLKTRGGTDYINGFVEQLKDPRGVIGNFEGMAAFVSDAQLVERLADSAEYFERAMPWPEQFKRKRVSRPVSNVASVLVGTGDMGPVPWAGYNLPNYADIRSEVGSKNVIFLNIMTARSGKDAEARLKEFYLPEYQQVVREWGELATNWNVYMHEIIGHGSGQPDPGLSDDPRNLIGRSFAALEEARADLVALYFIPDAKLVEIGAIPKGQQDAVVQAAYARYFQGFLSLYSRFHGGTVKEAHWKGRQLILRYLLNGGDGGEGDYGLSLVQVGGKYFVKIGDPVKVRAGIGTLLRRIQVIKSLGQKEEAEALVDRFGGTYDEAIAANISERSKKIGVARQSAFVFPRLDAVVDRDGTITDVKVRHDEDLTAQQLRYTRLQQGRDLE